jgi:hypothetical protein
VFPQCVGIRLRLVFRHLGCSGYDNRIGVPPSVDSKDIYIGSVYTPFAVVPATFHVTVCVEPLIETSIRRTDGEGPAVVFTVNRHHCYLPVRQRLSRTVSPDPLFLPHLAFLLPISMEVPLLF